MRVLATELQRAILVCGIRETAEQYAVYIQASCYSDYIIVWNLGESVWAFLLMAKAE